ncbi:hypothetical protein IIZ81_03495 [Candidatus Saccharibacteria bacterium]|nr:hypothetical protein [Candidatus Saccharibacteria bacterium]
MSEEIKNAVATAETEAAKTPVVADDVRTKLAEYGADEATIDKVISELGVEELDDLASLEVADLTGAGMKLAKARKLVAELKNTSKPAAPAVAAAETRAIQSQFEALLPSIPTDESWLNALKTGGILKVDESSYIAAIHAALADRAGLYNVPDALSKAMEKYADETEEQVDPIFYALRKSLTRRTYGDIFAAIDGLDGTFITDARRKEFLGRIRDTLWPAIAESYRTLDGWYQTWRASFSDPSMLIAAIGGGFSGGVAGMSMITPPDTAQLHDAGDTLVDSINRVFRGTGVQVAAAMAYDANIIRNTLEDPRLPSMVGVKNREMMLKKIGASVSSNYIRLEQNLVKYVLAFVKHDTVTSDVEVNYFVALWQLGTQINWAELGGGDATGMTGLTGKRIL